MVVGWNGGMVLEEVVIVEKPIFQKGEGLF